MLAYHGSTELKIGLLAEVEKHRLADQIIKGTYGENISGYFRGCAVGCSINSFNNLRGESLETSDHAAYEAALGIPKTLARLEDRIFEGLPDELAVTWPGRFLSAITPGADLSEVWPKLVVWLLTDAEHGVIRYVSNVGVKKAIERVAEVYRTSGTKEQFRDAADAADAAYAAAADAAADAAYASAAADADAAAYAAYAAYAADAAYAAYATYAAYVAADADADARQKAFAAQSEKLLELLAEA